MFLLYLKHKILDTDLKHSFADIILLTPFCELLRTLYKRECCKLHRSFENFSKVYRILEYITFGTLLQRARRSSLRVFESHPEARVLILGDGDGHFSCKAILRYPNTSIDSLDFSWGMLAAAINRIRKADSNALTYAYLFRYYAVFVSQFFIDCIASDEANDLIARLILALKPGVSFSCVDFAHSKLQPMTSFFKIAVPALYGFFRHALGVSNRQLPQIVWPGSLSCSDRAEWSQGFIVSESREKAPMSWLLEPSGKRLIPEFQRIHHTIVLFLGKRPAEH